MNDNKIIFLDIDGTIVEFSGNIPKSTKIAIKEAQKNGHKLVICSGRSKYQIYPELLELGFDGIIAAAGGYVEYQGKEIYHRFIDEENRKNLMKYLEDNKFLYDIQTDTHTIANERCAKEMSQAFIRKGIGEEHLKKIIGNLEIREDVWNNDREEKVIYDFSPFCLEKVRADIAPDFEVTASSLDSADNSGEISIAGINKATGMQVFLNHINERRENTIAVGDGPNDFDMLEFANVGIAMGNAKDELKQKADYVTTPIYDDGIYNAFKKFGLI